MPKTDMDQLFNVHNTQSTSLDVSKRPLFYDLPENTINSLIQTSLKFHNDSDPINDSLLLNDDDYTFTSKDQFEEFTKG
ncbi:unnamed protein product [Didymodactylos carnosus]|uniref:Uncharacterized protein n=2 Tax=Didymodactylos carnosus TaxID=1234261 RepID=A0A8S2FNC9_9BILA|nr:unnamed protein product [Didymodactylos carnosus]CAF4304027.1 unnamed protein product [Didymodactylos carnosus]